MTSDRIEIHPKVMLGKPVIRGTRIPVELLTRKLREGMTQADLLDAYPRLTPIDIKAALESASLQSPTPTRVQLPTVTLAADLPMARSRPSNRPVKAGEKCSPKPSSENGTEFFHRNIRIYGSSTFSVDESRPSDFKGNCLRTGRSYGAHGSLGCGLSTHRSPLTGLQSGWPLIRTV